jgi:disulfide bond formation protein DsbB
MTHIIKGLLLALFTIAICTGGAIAQSKPDVMVDSMPDGHGGCRLIAYRDVPLNRRMAISDAPYLQGATMGTIGPQGTDATMIQGLMTAGTVKVNNLSNLEAALKIYANIALILGHIVGIYYLIRTIMLTAKTPGKVLGGLAKGFTFISIGLLSPAFVNWALNAAVEAALF